MLFPRKNIFQKRISITHVRSSYTYYWTAFEFAYMLYLSTAAMLNTEMEDASLSLKLPQHGYFFLLYFDIREDKNNNSLRYY